MASTKVNAITNIHLNLQKLKKKKINYQKKKAGRLDHIKK